MRPRPHHRTSPGYLTSITVGTFPAVFLLVNILLLNFKLYNIPVLNDIVLAFRSDKAALAGGGV